MDYREAIKTAWKNRLSEVRTIRVPELDTPEHGEMTFYVRPLNSLELDKIMKYFNDETPIIASLKTIIARARDENGLLIYKPNDTDMKELGSQLPGGVLIKIATEINEDLNIDLPAEVGEAKKN